MGQAGPNNLDPATGALDQFWPHTFLAHDTRK